MASFFWRLQAKRNQAGCILNASVNLLPCFFFHPVRRCYGAFFDWLVVIDWNNIGYNGMHSSTIHMDQ